MNILHYPGSFDKKRKGPGPKVWGNLKDAKQCNVGEHNSRASANLGEQQRL